MRKITKTVSKFVAKDTINGWDTTYEYEVVNGVLKDDLVAARGIKDAVTANLSKVAESVNSSFSAGEPDYEYATVVFAEITAIKAEIIAAKEAETADSNESQITEEQ